MLASLVSASIPALVASIEAIASVAATGSPVVGCHVEGPFRAERFYFVSIKTRNLGETTDLLHPPTERWMPVTSSAHTELLPIVRGRLRPPPAPAPVLDQSLASRDDYEITLVSQPGVRRPSGPTRWRATRYPVGRPWVRHLVGQAKNPQWIAGHLQHSIRPPL
jgi:hypothetical protein